MDPLESIQTHENDITHAPTQSSSQQEEVPSIPQPKKKRLLSSKQLEALKRGREKRWERMNGSDNKPSEPMKAPEVESEQEEEDDSDSFSDSSSDEELKKKRKASKLKKAIPRKIRKKVDKYIKHKLEESKSKGYLDPYYGYPSEYNPPPYTQPYPDTISTNPTSTSQQLHKEEGPTVELVP